MATATKPVYETFADIQRRLGGVAPARIRLNPTPGTATERDVVRLLDRSNRMFELVDGILVEKPMGLAESWIALELGRLVGNYVAEHDLGLMFGTDCPVRFGWRLVRFPDLCFVSWTRLPTRSLPDGAVLGESPDLAVEVISPSNTRREMQRKLVEYFNSGVREVWMIHPRKRIVEVFTGPTQSRRLTEAQWLDGGDILPGFRLMVRTIFARSRPTKGGGRG